jgi:hypothetical protein
MRTARLLLACTALLAVAACGEDEPDPQIEAGGCVSVAADDSIEPVACDAEDAAHRLIVQIAEGYPCPADLTSLSYVQTLDGKEIGVPQRWCVADAGAELTSEQQEYLDQAQSAG